MQSVCVQYHVVIAHNEHFVVLTIQGRLKPHERPWRQKGRGPPFYFVDEEIYFNIFGMSSEHTVSIL